MSTLASLSYEPASPVRLARVEDTPRLANIYNAAIATGLSTMDASPRSPFDFLRALRSQDRREAIVVLPDPHGVPLGYGVLKRYSPREGYAVAAETSIYVAEHARRRGVGAHLQNALIGLARERG